MRIGNKATSFTEAVLDEEDFENMPFTQLKAYMSKVNEQIGKVKEGAMVMKGEGC